MSQKRGTRWFSDDGRGLDRFGLVLGLAALSVATLSLIDLDDATSGLKSEIGWLIVTGTVGLTLVASLRASGVARRPRRIAELLIGVVVGGIVLFTLADGLVGVTGSNDLDVTRPSLLWTLIAAVSPIVVLRRVMKHDRITMETLLGAVSVYLLLALAFNYAFLGLNNAAGASSFFENPESTSSFMYFSLTTITTVGYGDLAAVSDLGRFLATTEAVLGQVLLVTVVARLVSLYSSSRHDPTSTHEQGDASTVE